LEIERSDPRLTILGVLNQTKPGRIEATIKGIGHAASGGENRAVRGRVKAQNLGSSSSVDSKRGGDHANQNQIQRRKNAA
jgi:hypothetical protein